MVPLRQWDHPGPSRTEVLQVCFRLANRLFVNHLVLSGGRGYEATRDLAARRRPDRADRRRSVDNCVPGRGAGCGGSSSDQQALRRQPRLLRTAQVVVRECWMDERLWELSPARNVA